MPTLQELTHLLFAADSIWSVALRGAIWLIIALVIIVSTDQPDPDKAFKNLKSNLGFFLMFVVVSSGLVYLLFGFTAA